MTPDRGEGGRAELRVPGSTHASSTDQEQQKNPSDLTSVSSLCSSAAGKGRFPVGSAQAALVPASSGEGWVVCGVVCPASLLEIWFRMG